jgi:CxxC-x17-CxxC domain-containing protein
MEYHDKVLKCADCGAEFVFTAGEQMFFADKGFKNEPKRCKNCKSRRGQGGGDRAGGGGGGGGYSRSETQTTCSQCGKETTVPFKPTQGRPVYCRECFQQRRAMGQPTS